MVGGGGCVASDILIPQTCALILSWVRLVGALGECISNLKTAFCYANQLPLWDFLGRGWGFVRSVLVVEGGGGSRSILFRLCRHAFEKLVFNV